MPLCRALKEKQPQYKERHGKVNLQHDNARPSEMGQSGGRKICRNVEMGHFTSPATVVSRCCSVSFSPHSLRSVVHGLAHQHFSPYEEMKNWIDSWILSKDEKFFHRGIHLLPERWAKVVANDSEYFEM
nr:Mariner Mos1 transposase [Hymenolepis microstoma]